MAEPRKEKPDSPEKAVREAVAETEAPAEARSISVDRLIANSGKYLGHPSHVASGALSGLNRKNLTVEEAKAAVDAWLKSPVKKEG